MGMLEPSILGMKRREKNLRRLKRRGGFEIRRGAFSLLSKRAEKRQVNLLTWLIMFMMGKRIK